MSLGEEDAARENFERALLLDPNSVEAHSLLGHLQLRDGDLAGAENRFKVGRRAQDEDPMILFGLGNVYLTRGDSANAMKFLARAAEYKPEDAAIQASLGRALFDQGAFGLAEKAFENALRMRPDLSLAKLFLARSRLRQNRLDEAREGFADLLAARSQLFGAYAGLGDVARKKKQVVKALKFYKHALELDPAHPGAINACAWCMENLGDLPAAARYLTEGLRHAPAADELRAPLIGILDQLGRSEEAAQVRAAMGKQR
jgi:tetratricopeptide (TPR) repeat protein